MHSLEDQGRFLPAALTVPPYASCVVPETSHTKPWQLQFHSLCGS